MIECCSGWTGLVPLEGEADQGRKVWGGGGKERERVHEGGRDSLAAWLEGERREGKENFGDYFRPKTREIPVKSKPG